MNSVRLACLLFLAPILAAAAQRPAYVFTYFIGNGEDGLHLAGSDDGYLWEALNGGRSYLKSEVGESKLMRDPCVARGPDGTFHLVWTTAWQGSTIGYASSRDLAHWTEPRALPVMAGEPGVRNCWAPEIVYDAAKGEFVIFWASTIRGKFSETAGSSESDYNHRIYATRTRDFQTFTPTELFYDPGFSVIDATIFPALGRWHLVVKDETVKPPKKHLRLASAEKATGPWGALSEPFTRDWVEGPTVLQVGDDYVVYFDVYREKHYGAVRSRDLQHWEDVTAAISLPKGLRHGTAIQVDPALLAALRAPSTR